MIVRRQPLAYELRQIMVALRISTDLERIGDLARTSPSGPPWSASSSESSYARLEAHGRASVGQLKEVLDACNQRDADRA